VANPNVIIAIDIGTSSLKSVAFRHMDDADWEIVAVVVTPSTAFTPSSSTGELISHHEECRIALTQNLRDLECEIDGPAAEIACTCMGVQIHTRLSIGHSDLKPGPRAVDMADIENTIGMLHGRADRAERATPLIVTREFKIDGVSRSSPLGIATNRLDMSVVLRTVSIEDLALLGRLFADAGYRMDFYADTAAAAGLALLSSDENEGRRLIIDIGKHATAYMLFHDGLPLDSFVVHQGGQYMTSDLADVMGDVDVPAEAVKCRLSDYRRGGVTRFDDPAAAYIASLPKGRLAELDEVIMARLQEIIASAGRRHAFCHGLDGVVLTGGGARYHCTKAVADDIFDIPVSVRHCPVPAGEAPPRSEEVPPIPCGIHRLRRLSRKSSIRESLENGRPAVFFPDDAVDLHMVMERLESDDTFWRDLGLRFAADTP